jgi:AhpD family alkylhydroperoxidase
MNQQTKELIAIGASVTANCQPCLEFHVGKAREYGAGEKDISMAVAVGKTVRKGAAAKMDEFAKSVSESSTVASSGRDSECECGGN